MSLVFNVYLVYPTLPYPSCRRGRGVFLSHKLSSPIMRGFFTLPLLLNFPLNTLLLAHICPRHSNPLTEVILHSIHTQRKQIPFLPSTPSKMPEDTTFDVLTATAHELQSLLKLGKITSVQIVKHYLEQIGKHNDHLHALIEVTPEEHLLAFAEKLDNERAQNQTRGNLHGIPIIVKVSVPWVPVRLGSAFQKSALNELSKRIIL